METTDAELLAAARRNAVFIPSDTWRGMLLRYAFKMGTCPEGHSRLGYYLDPAQRPLRESVISQATPSCVHCAIILQNLPRKLHPATQKPFRPRAWQPRASNWTACRSKSRCYACCATCTWGSAPSAWRLPSLATWTWRWPRRRRAPPVGLRSPDALRRAIDGLKTDAQQLKAKQGYMHNRLADEEQAAASPRVISPVARLNDAQGPSSRPSPPADETHAEAVTEDGPITSAVPPRCTAPLHV